MTAYYNEHDPFAAAWLRELIAAGLIAPGDVDERSIVDVSASDLDGYTQCHFFAGIGGWSAALRLAGWPDDRPVWTGSCPCQPFSSAGKRAGVTDERHLWPAWWRLVCEQRPGVIVGEQVGGADGAAWWDAASSDLETGGYSIGALDLDHAGFGLPHARQRLFWVAYADSHRQPRRAVHAEAPRAQGVAGLADHDWYASRVLDAERDGLPGVVGRRRGYGNAIVPQVAAEFIGAVMEVAL